MIMNLIAYIGMGFTSNEVRKYAIECANKYIGHLSDQELNNFDVLF